LVCLSPFFVIISSLIITVGGNKNLSSMPSLEGCVKLRMIDVKETEIEKQVSGLSQKEIISHFQKTQ